MASYAVIETGGKQYRVEKGSTLLVDRLSAKEGEKVDLRPVAFRDKEMVLGEDLEKVKVEAKVAGTSGAPSCGSSSTGRRRATGSAPGTARSSPAWRSRT